MKEIGREIGAKDPAKQGQVKAHLDTKALDLQMRTRAIQMKVASLGSVLPGGRGLRHATVGVEEPERASSTGAVHYFQKQPFLKFDRQKRNYPSFRREWTDTVSSSYLVDFQIREIRRNVPKIVEPDLKNLKTMQEVWAFLDQVYG